jgi:predicted nucleic-acid-binding protein
MTGVDTNVLARFFTQDDPDQSVRAEDFLQSLTREVPGFVSLVSLAELVWVMRRRYGATRSQLIEVLERLLNSPELILESHSAVTQALQRFAGAKADFADCLIERCGHLAGCSHTVTFDVNASESAGMKLL